ncbi:calcium-transporting ATPase type 2C member 1 isoform X1 [Aphis craccivora]|uniref:Calcium-transporting ATPase type 2C member 1 isoform X1 n=1 Tax=Aphis craccivora TaxID=307492 RepID=A0A6G0Z5T5_APHCR|nr:calcium-transporting ATPase type 2C member 1 isoform X1 [Aphis craccivora]
MESSPVARSLREPSHGQAQNDQQTPGDDASSEPCYIDDVSVSDKLTVATVVTDNSETTTVTHDSVPTAVMTANDTNATAARTFDDNIPNAVTTAGEEVTNAVATLEVTTIDDEAVTSDLQIFKVSFVRKFKPFLIFFSLDTALIRRYTRICVVPTVLPTDNIDDFHNVVVLFLCS